MMLLHEPDTQMLLLLASSFFSSSRGTGGASSSKASVRCLEYGQLYVMSKEDLVAFTETVPRLRLLCWGGHCFE